MKIYPIQKQQINISKTMPAFKGGARKTNLPYDVFEKGNLATSKKTSEINEPSFIFALSKIEDKQSAFRNFDFEKEGFHIELKYPRKAFIEDVETILKGKSEEEKEKLFSDFGFRLIKSNGTKSLEGYPKTKRCNIFGAKDKKEEELNRAVKKFSEDNSILIEGEDELSFELTGIFSTFPELYTTVGKKQNNTHDFTLDIHTLCVLQNVMNDPDFEMLDEDDKRLLQITALLHDISKKEGVNDETHAETGAIAANFILKKIKMPKKKKEDISKLIQEHEWLKNYNSPRKNEFERTEFAKQLAQRLKEKRLAKMEVILTKADMMAVKKEGAFFEHYKKAFYQGKKELMGFAAQKNSCLFNNQKKDPPRLSSINF